MKSDAVDRFVLHSQVNLFKTFKPAVYEIDDMIINSILQNMYFEKIERVPHVGEVITFDGKTHSGSRSIPFSDVDVFCAPHIE